jgi:hypothetical protein
LERRISEYLVQEWQQVRKSENVSRHPRAWDRHKKSGEPNVRIWYTGKRVRHGTWQLATVILNSFSL